MRKMQYIIKQGFLAYFLLNFFLLFTMFCFVVFLTLFSTSFFLLFTMFCFVIFLTLFPTNFFYFHLLGFVLLYFLPYFLQIFHTFFYYALLYFLPQFQSYFPTMFTTYFIIYFLLYFNVFDAKQKPCKIYVSPSIVKLSKKRQNVWDIASRACTVVLDNTNNHKIKQACLIMNLYSSPR